MTKKAIITVTTEAEKQIVNAFEDFAHFVRNPYNYDREEASNRTALHCVEPSLTAQEFVEESDINYIAARFMKTGELKQVINMPRSGDFEGVFDFQSAMNLVVEAKQQFMDLPAKVRSRFNNDPAQLIDFLENMTEDDRAEAIALGLINKETNESRTQGTPEAKTQERPGTAGAAPGPGGPRAPEEPRGEAA